MKTDVLIIGGGLSGLHTAYSLHRDTSPDTGTHVTLIEARNRLGGRILSRSGPNSDGSAYDLGPTWFWPGQHRMEALVRTLELEREIFEQPSAGEALYENDSGAVLRGLGGASMAGSYRLDGGLAKIIRALAEQLPDDTVQLRTRATHITQHGDRLHTTIHRDGHDSIINSARIVIALPPRLAVNSISLSPDLPTQARDLLQHTATWMAGSAKLVALYDEPFWRKDGLSGDAISYRGPLGEIHDASPRTNGPAALFGFVSVPPDIRRNQEDALKEAALAQLEKLFGHQAAHPRDVYVKDWAFDNLTATAADQEPQITHPAPWSGAAPEISWEGRLMWSGSETAEGGLRNTGYLEGALEASERTVHQLAKDGVGSAPS